MASKKSKKNKKIKRMLLLGFTSVFIIIFTVYTIGNYWVDIYNKYQEKNELEEELILLQEEEKELEVDSKMLQDPEYVAKYAREKYLYTKDGEFVLRMPEE